jgi:hypothetical protein
MEYWGSIADDSLILFSALCHSYKNRSHTAKPSIPTFHYSNTPWHHLRQRLLSVIWPIGPGFQCWNKTLLSILYVSVVCLKLKLHRPMFKKLTAASATGKMLPEDGSTVFQHAIAVHPAKVNDMISGTHTRQEGTSVS